MTQALNQMPADLRQALVLCELDGLSYDEIARQMNCPVGTVKSRISRARECLGKVIRPYMDRN
jgi:RNA polymerase sigma-70 factor (ECF subfamily)